MVEEATETQAQAKADLLEMFRCPGWQTAKKLMRIRMREIEWTLATDFRASDEDVKERQREHRLIRALLENPLEWFLSGVKRIPIEAEM